MIEIFSNVSQKAKDNAQFIFDMAMRQKNITDMIDVMNTYTSTCEDENERNFIEFYFNMRMEQSQHENYFIKR